jgi:predicted HTH domain antitoxin
MRRKRTTLELPADLVDLLDAAGEDVSRGVEEALVVELIRKTRISTGKGAEILGITKDEMRDLMWEHGIPYFRQTFEEVLQDAEVAAAAADRAKRDERRK